MYGGDLRVLEIYGEASDLGRAHGAECAALIAKYLEDRIDLCTDERWGAGGLSRGQVVEAAAETLEHHERFSESLYAELTALADAAGITPAEAVVVGGFTDLLDVLRARVATTVTEDGCTAVIDPRAGVVAQTWDMHASAGEFVVLLKLDPITGPCVVVQTTAGCLGQIGINEAGIAIGINNLTTVGKPGVTWPFVVRQVLAQTDFDAAVQVVLEADLAGGHNFLLMGPDGTGVNIEATAAHRVVTQVSGEPFVHTNHCLYDATASEEVERLLMDQESSDARLEVGSELAGDLEAFFANPTISRRGEGHDVATCGAVIMEPRERRLRAVWGLPGEHPWETFQL
ncbi:MAG: C45 family autoproteolytic acyltransferase/hydrolase [Acidimicrobiia bacterium]